ncbi:hypothetical protein [Halarchaeum salinum]|uniref:hypothetical protein n=1 Tax=Halarchaeum salinum TaxID=489912 RepID=UPI0031E30B29
MKTTVRGRLPDPPATPVRTVAGAVEHLFAFCAALGVVLYALGLLAGTPGAASLGVGVGVTGAAGNLLVASTRTWVDTGRRRR